MEIFEHNDIVLSIGNQQITGKDCVVSSMNVNVNNNVETAYSLNRKSPPKYLQGVQDITITLELICRDMIQQFWDKDFKPKIRNKKVEDCTIQELLFAIREKVRLGDK